MYNSIKIHLDTGRQELRLKRTTCYANGRVHTVLANASKATGRAQKILCAYGWCALLGVVKLLYFHPRFIYTKYTERAHTHPSLGRFVDADEGGLRCSR